MLYNRRFLCAMFLAVKISTAGTSTIENALAINRRDVEANENLEMDPAIPKERRKVSQTEKYTPFRIIGEDLEQIDTKTLYTSINKITDHEKLSFLFTIVNFDDGTTVRKQDYMNIINEIFINIRKRAKESYFYYENVGYKVGHLSAVSYVNIDKVQENLKMTSHIYNLLVALTFDYLHHLAYDALMEIFFTNLSIHILEAYKERCEAKEYAASAIGALTAIAEQFAYGDKVIDTSTHLQCRRSLGLKKIEKKIKEYANGIYCETFELDKQMYNYFILRTAQLTYKANFVKCCQDIASGLLPELRLLQNQDKFREFYVKTFNRLTIYLKDIPASEIEALTKKHIDSYVDSSEIRPIEEPLRERFELMLPSLRYAIRKTRENKTCKVKNITSFVCRGEIPEEMHMPALIEILRETECFDIPMGILADCNQGENLCQENVGKDSAMLGGIRYNPKGFDEAEYLKILDEYLREVTNPATEVRTQRFCNII